MQIISKYYNLNNLNSLSYNFEYICKNKFLFFKLKKQEPKTSIFDFVYNFTNENQYKYKFLSITKREPEYSLHYHLFSDFGFLSIKENLNIKFINFKEKVVYWDEYQKVILNLNNYFDYANYEPIFEKNDFYILFVETLIKLLRNTFDFKDNDYLLNLAYELQINKNSYEDLIKEAFDKNIIFYNVYNNFKNIYDMYLNNYFYDYNNFLKNLKFKESFEND